MYYGEAHTSIDEKGRLPVPMQFRRVMEANDHDTWIITLGYDNELWLYHKQRWEELEKTEFPAPTIAPDKLAFRTRLFGKAMKVKLDGQGRLLIPQTLRDAAGLNREGILVGVQDHLQLWNETAWREFNAQQASMFKQTAAKLSESTRQQAPQFKEEASDVND